MEPSTCPSRSATGLQFRLRSLLLVVTWLALVFALAGSLPVVGILVAVLSVPALVRTWRFTTQPEAVDGPLSTGELADTFLSSLAILVALGATSLLVVASAAGVALLACLAAAAWLCGFAPIAMLYVGGHALETLRPVGRVTARHWAWTGGFFTPRPVGLGSRMAGVVALPGVLICASVAVGLGLVLALAVAIGVLGHSIAALGMSFRWLERQVLAGLHRLLQWKSQLIARFRGPHALSYAAPESRS